ncbi:hypothetical protein PVAND_011845 [Polypedilum vanderplanki]|uniref:Uncharacterized protein n=1 Tax=Polypedilum vanderplanki TaxID=319348 RepID=A0A9J6CLL9_POLVA|nr:hypothetical protein PVAND_011845 [Polypedilum vanderplanki]
MTKLAIVFIAIFLCIQLVYCNTADDNTESDDTTSKGFLDQLQNVFTEENANKAKEHFKGVFNSAKNLTDKLTNDVKKFFEITTAAPEP